VKSRSRDEVTAALPAGARTLAAALLEAADRRNLGVYLVGGPVRDLLLGRVLRDVDLIVEPRDGQGAAELVRAASLAGVRVVSHDRFGTLRLESERADAEEKGALDVATVRSERYAHPGALPTVGPGTLDDDLRRRDFTVNALAIPLSASARRAHPALVDLDDGLRDLETRTLRVFHPGSFHDDPTRALRAARLAARLGFALSRSSRSALRDALRDGVFGRVSGERLKREFDKLFEDARLGLDPAVALGLLAEWHVLGALEPGLSLPRRSIAPLRRLGRTIAAPSWPPRRARPWAAGLATWFAPLDAGLRTRALRRFAVRGELAQWIAGFPKQRDATLRALARARGRGAIDAVLGPVSDEAMLALFALAPPTVRRRILRHAVEDRPRRPPVTGEDLLALGLAGPAVGRALARIRSAFLDGAVKTREDALALARELGRGRSAGASRGRRSARAQRGSTPPCPRGGV
jgi:tRNA nucleotidyltransferase (CCA-adding enzyme)